MFYHPGRGGVVIEHSAAWVILLTKLQATVYSTPFDCGSEPRRHIWKRKSAHWQHGHISVNCSPGTFLLLRLWLGQWCIVVRQREHGSETSWSNITNTSGLLKICEWLRLLIYLWIDPFIHKFIHSSIHPLTDLPIFLSVYEYLHVSIYLSIYLWITPCIYLSIVSSKHHKNPFMYFPSTNEPLVSVQSPVDPLR